MSSREQHRPIDYRKLVGRCTARALLLFQGVKTGMAAVIVAVGLAAIVMSYRSPGPSKSWAGGGPQVATATTGSVTAHRPVGPAGQAGPAVEVTKGTVSAPVATSGRPAKRSSARARIADVAATPIAPTDVVVPASIPPPAPMPAAIPPTTLSLAPNPSPVAAPIQAPATPPPPASTKSKSTADLVLSVNKDAVIGVRLDQTVTTDTARVDDKVTARVSRDVVVDGRTAIPAGSRLEGVVTLVERAGPSHDRDRLGIRFSTLVLSGNKRVPIQTDTIFRDSDRGEPLAAQGGSAALAARVSGTRPRPLPNTTGRSPARTIGTGAARIPGGSPLTVKLTAPLSIVMGSDPAST